VKLPVLPIRDLVMFPGLIAPLFVGRPRSHRAVEEATLRDKQVFVVAQKDPRTEDPKADDLYRVGVVCTILQMVRLPDGSTKVLVEGNERARVAAYESKRDHMLAEIEPLTFEAPYSDNAEPLKRSVVEQFERYVNLHPKIPLEVLASLTGIESPFLLSDLVASPPIPCSAFRRSRACWRRLTRRSAWRPFFGCSFGRTTSWRRSIPSTTGSVRPWRRATGSTT